MLHYDTVAHFFQQHIEQVSLSVDAIADIAGTAAVAATEAIFAEQKLLICGIGADVAGATLLSELLRKGLLRERPALPVVELCARHAEPESGGISWLAQQITALGQAGDMAFVFAATLDREQLDFLASALNKREVNAVWIGSQGPGTSLAFPGATNAAALALSHASAICLAELIDVTAFGPLEDNP